MPNNLFCVDDKSKIYITDLIFYIVLLCPLCSFNNKHNEEHYVINIEDKESLEDSGISYQKSVSEFDKMFKNAKNIKQNIEEEMKKLNVRHDKLIGEINMSFKEQHLILNEKENKLKAELNLKVDEVKKELEKFLMKSNEVLLICEKLFNAINYYDKKNNRHEIQTLYYLSEIQKTKKNAKNFMRKPIKNLDISYHNLSNEILYNYYYFSGSPIPKGIKIKKKDDKIFISWNIGDVKKNDFYGNNIKFFVHIENEVISKVYQTFEKCILLNKNEFKMENDNEVKILSIVDKYTGKWSKSKKFKIDELPENVFGKLFNNNQEGKNYKKILYKFKRK